MNISPSQSNMSQLAVFRRAQSVLLAQNAGQENLMTSGVQVGDKVGYTVGVSVGISVGKQSVGISVGISVGATLQVI